MKRRRRLSRLTLIKRFRPLLLLVVLAVSLFFPALITHQGVLGMGDEATMALFGVVVTALGALFVVYELNDTERINRCDTLFNLNMKFVENDRFMNLYQALSECVRDPSKKIVINDNDPNAIHSSDLMGYMTFYEVINEFIIQGVLDVQQMDDLFGDRFFKLVHNDCVQERELYAEPSSYVNIFELYDAWAGHRITENEKGENRLVVSEGFAIPDLYLRKKLYLRETTQLFHNKEQLLFTNSGNHQIKLDLRRLLPRDFKSAINLQKDILETIDPELFQKSTEEEILESMLIDYCYGLFDGDELAAFCICVLNRKTRQMPKEEERNLCVLTDDTDKYHDYISFDTIQVAPKYRGYGIQRFFLKEAESLVRETNAKHIIATVSPKNVYSKNAFLNDGYSIYGNRTITAYGNKQRYLVYKTIV